MTRNVRNVFFPHTTQTTWGRYCLSKNISKFNGIILLPTYTKKLLRLILFLPLSHVNLSLSWSIIMSVCDIDAFIVRPHLHYYSLSVSIVTNHFVNQNTSVIPNSNYSFFTLVNILHDYKFRIKAFSPGNSYT